MNDAQKKMKRYTNAVERRLNLPREVKHRVMSDFISSIAARREAGQTDEEIYAELGSPKKAAADLNDQMKEYAYRKSPWRFACLTAAILAGVKLVHETIMWCFLHDRHGSIGIIGGADGPTAIFMTSPVTVVWNWMDTLLAAAVLAAGLLGFWLLSRCRKK